MNDRLFRPLFSTLILLSLCSLAIGATSPSSLLTLRANAQKGNAIAQYNLGLILADPNEPAYDLVEAYVWLSRAAAGGSRSRDLNRVSDLLTPAQLREAQAQLAPVPTVSITPLDDEDFGPATLSLTPSPVVTSPDPELRKRLAIAESALAVRERDLAKLREELEAQAKPSTLDGSPNAVAEIEFLRAQLAASTAETKALREELNRHRSTQATDQQSRDELEQSLNQLRGQLRETTADLAASRANLARATTEAADSTELNLLRDQLAALTSQRDELQVSDPTELKLAREQIQALTNQRDRLQTRLESRDESQHTQVAALEAQLKALQAQLFSRSNEPTSAPQIQELETQLAAATSDVMALREELTGLRSTQAAVQTARDELAAQLSQTQEELTILQAQSATVTSLQSELADTRKKLAEQSSAGPELAAAQAKIQSLNEDVANSWKSQGRLQSQLAEGKQAYGAAQAELESLKVAHDTQTQNLTTAQAQLEQLRTQLAAASTTPAIDPAVSQHVQDLETQLAQARQAHAATQAELANLAQTRDSQSNDLTNARARIEQLQLVAAEQRSALEAEVAQLRTELANVPPPAAADPANTKRIANLESQLAASAQSRAQLERTLTEAQAKIRETATDLAASRASLAQANAQSAPNPDSAELNLVREQLAAVAAQRDELQAVLAQRNGSSQTQLAALETELNDLRSQLRLQTTETQRLRDQLATASVETEVLRTAQSEIDQLHQQLTAAQQSAAERIDPTPTPTIAADTSANQEKLATSLRAFAAVEAQLRTSRQKLEEAQKDADADAAKIADLESQIADLQPTLATAQVAAENAQSEASDAALALAETRAQLASTQADLDRLSREFATFRESNADQFRTAEILAAKNADLSTQVRQTQQQYAEASRELADLRTRYALSVTNAVASSPNVRTAPARPTPAVSDGVRIHTVVSGDSLSRIAEQYLGSEDRWPEIYAANRSTLSAANGVRAGMVLLIP